jgi:hypothetical protein
MLRVEAASLGSQEQTLKAAVDRADMDTSCPRIAAAGEFARNRSQALP